MNLAIIFLLIVICFLLFDIRSRLPEKDYIKEAQLRDKMWRESREKGKEFD
ncbi:hypothetical protein [Paenibacillus nanensis]|uniref:hypothetical protein n=1 Tax=Paenibacillus nanensis TaxID=393251 RepID=UPI0013C37A47|nr:hypothetical protein [Paenibacillus nanensis]